MAFVSEMFDQLRDLLADPTDTQVPFATKKLYLNRGIQRLWPAIYRVQTTVIPLTPGIYDYDLLSSTYRDAHIFSVEYAGDAGGQWDRLNRYDVIGGDEDETGILRIPFWAGIGSSLRVRRAAPIDLITATSYSQAQSEVWNGPDRAIGLPPLAAMGFITLRKLDVRQDLHTYSTQQATNGVTDTDIMSVAQMWFGQFENELSLVEMAMPIATD